MPLCETQSSCSHDASPAKLSILSAAACACACCARTTSACWSAKAKSVETTALRPSAMQIAEPTKIACLRPSRAARTLARRKRIHAPRDDPRRAHAQRRRQVKAQLRGGALVDHQLEAARELNRQLGDIGAAQDEIDTGGDQLARSRRARPYRTSARPRRQRCRRQEIAGSLCLAAALRRSLAKR